jgi:redox-sensing transcriptional repressor
MRKIAESTVRRLSMYLRLLEEFAVQGVGTVRSEALASRGGTTSAQVRKDLSFFGSFGKRGLGYAVPELVGRLRDILGLERSYGVVVVGAGKIGTALAQYRGFSERGFHVVAVYDADPSKIGASRDGPTVRDVRYLERDLAGDPADIAILSTPAGAAQAVAESLVRGGVRAILNFAPIQLDVPPHVTVKDVNMALELETLSYALRQERAGAGRGGQKAAPASSRSQEREDDLT